MNLLTLESQAEKPDSEDLFMAIPVIMPRQGQSVESCLIGKWHKQVGEPVAVGDILFTYETDKATFDESSKVAGTLLAIFFSEGDDVPCLTNVCVIGDATDSYAEFDPNSQAVAQPQEAPVQLFVEVQPALDAADSTQSISTELPAKISPRARGLAEKSGADLRLAQATGPHGRVITADVERLISEGKMSTGAAGTVHPASQAGSGLGGRVSIADLGKPVETQAVPVAVAPVSPVQGIASDEDTRTEKHSNIRKVIARSMHASISQMAQLTMNASFDATDMLALRARLKKAADSGLAAEIGAKIAEKVPTINDLILFAVSRVLPRHLACNAHYDDEKMTYFKHVHLGVAVDTPRGLMVPTIFSADLLGINDLGQEIKAASAACQAGTISPDQLKGGTFTVTNLGSLGIESFTPVINPPQTCILGVNTIVPRVREVGGEVKVYSTIPLSLTFDHRALDGAPAARFLKDLVKALENISLLLMQG